MPEASFEFSFVLIASWEFLNPTPVRQPLLPRSFITITISSQQHALSAPLARLEAACVELASVRIFLNPRALSRSMHPLSSVLIVFFLLFPVPVRLRVFVYLAFISSSVLQFQDFIFRLLFGLFFCFIFTLFFCFFFTLYFRFFFLFFSHLLDRLLSGALLLFHLFCLISRACCN